MLWVKLSLNVKFCWCQIPFTQHMHVTPLFVFFLLFPSLYLQPWCLPSVLCMSELYPDKVQLYTGVSGERQADSDLDSGVGPSSVSEVAVNVLRRDQTVALCHPGSQTSPNATSQGSFPPPILIYTLIYNLFLSLYDPAFLFFNTLDLLVIWHVHVICSSGYVLIGDKISDTL